MITIIYEDGVIDATGCRIHIKSRTVVPVNSELPTVGEGYNLVLTRLDNGEDFVIKHYPSKAFVEGKLNAIIQAIQRGDECVDIRITYLPSVDGSEEST